MSTPVFAYFQYPLAVLGFEAKHTVLDAIGDAEADLVIAAAAGIPDAGHLLIMRLDTVTSRQRALFIEHLSKSANVTASARVAGFDRRTAYAHRLADPEFAADWDDGSVIVLINDRGPYVEGRMTAWCMDQRCQRNGPNPFLGSDDADIVRAAQLQHTVEDINRHADFSRPTFVYT